MTFSALSILALAIFISAYVLVMLEEVIHLKKSKPVVVAAGLIWLVIGLAHPGAHDLEEAASHLLAEYGALFLFLLVAITYVNTLEERRVFDALRVKLVQSGLSYRGLYWLIGVLSFLLSGVLDNLTTTLVMGAIALVVGKGAPRFLAVTCVSIVVAANAGGAFSPFGDITTLMVWQKGKVAFFEFFDLFVPSVINWLVPAVLMGLAMERGAPSAKVDAVRMKPGSIGVMVLFAISIALAISFHSVLGLPPALGMMLGLGLLQLWAYYLQRAAKRSGNGDMVLDAFRQIERVEWDTLLFFFGIIFAVGGLGYLGWLGLANTTLYGQFGPTTANIVIGLLSAVLDNIPLMYAVLAMDPAMSHGQWLLITLTCGVGGSLLAVGSAAGVALMAIAGEHYGVIKHLKWSWAILLGYAASIGTHLMLNASLF
ncbi:sodium:proton antiporter NhaD [Aestuariivirga litoralis]|uniref:sodium:proton antiporter NhaD n=1 Tax=Aestuariivirga litoralis TaxID=2650924 RepID=UPI0018C4C2C7|nr:sodium:proton antiporter NhaD [Aestuariivirga litoralis]MBG1232009.1 sodium:proton antiporter [Aestuariivirga litoralis]